MKNEKVLNLLGIILGIIIIIVGVYVMVTPADSYSTSSVIGYTFGADFYTEQYTATKAAADNAAVTANNLRELGEKLAQYVGLAFIFFGALTCLNYSKKYMCCAAVPTKSIDAEKASGTVDVAEANSVVEAMEE